MRVTITHKPTGRRASVTVPVVNNYRDPAGGKCEALSWAAWCRLCDRSLKVAPDVPDAALDIRDTDTGLPFEIEAEPSPWRHAGDRIRFYPRGPVALMDRHLDAAPVPPKET